VREGTPCVAAGAGGVSRIIAKSLLNQAPTFRRRVAGRVVFIQCGMSRMKTNLVDTAFFNLTLI
jgi:hypothetical protein